MEIFFEILDPRITIFWDHVAMSDDRLEPFGGAVFVWRFFRERERERLKRRKRSVQDVDFKISYLRYPLVVINLHTFLARKKNPGFFGVSYESVG